LFETQASARCHVLLGVLVLQCNVIAIAALEESFQQSSSLLA